VVTEVATLDVGLHPRQVDVYQSEATEILFGGAAGPGKSFLLRVLAILWCFAIPGLQVYLFRRISDDLVKNHVEGPKGFRALLAPWVNERLVEIVEGEIRFLWNGSKIYLCHCQEEKHRFKYQGAEIHVLLIDELTHFTEIIYRFLRGRVRMVGMKLPAAIASRFPRIVCGSNPGNIGHTWVKVSFVDGARDGEIRQMPKSEGGMKRQYIKALLRDNPTLLNDDPDYLDRLAGLGSAALVKAMLDGDWGAIEGAFFDTYASAVHEIPPFTIPADWTRFRSFDWGSARPFSVGWWAVVGDDMTLDDGRLLPRGALVRYREWYGVRKTPDGAIMANVGLKLKNSEIAAGIAERSGVIRDERGRLLDKGESYAYSVADPACFKQEGGPSIAEQIYNEDQTVNFIPADNARIAGWQQMSDRITGFDGVPMLFVFDTCTDSIRTIPSLMHDEHRAEDVDTDGEDHAADEWRYACMSRPWVKPKPVVYPRLPEVNVRQPTLGELTERHVQQWKNQQGSGRI
jgi:hypothetical protein